MDKAKYRSLNIITPKLPTQWDCYIKLNNKWMEIEKMPRYKESRAYFFLYLEYCNFYGDLLLIKAHLGGKPQTWNVIEGICEVDLIEFTELSIFYNLALDFPEEINGRIW